MREFRRSPEAAIAQIEKPHRGIHHFFNHANIKLPARAGKRLGLRHRLR